MQICWRVHASLGKNSTVVLIGFEKREKFIILSHFSFHRFDNDYFFFLFQVSLVGGSFTARLCGEKIDRNFIMILGECEGENIICIIPNQIQD